jgi:hypothetical protein
MSFAEISCRARQEISKWLDRRAEASRDRFGGTVPAALIERCLEEMPRRFFAGASDPGVPASLRERCPESAPRLVAAADRTLQKQFDLLGYRQLSFGDPIDWHLDPVTPRRAPLLHWTLLDPLDAATVGDSKVVWELSRHQWLVRLGQAYRLTGDERYAEMFADTIRDWRRANPPGMGINWTSSLEAAFRLISWCWSLSLFRGSAALTPRLRADLVEGIAGHASRIERYLSHYFSPNTHLTGEALGLFYAGTLFPLLPGASRWRREAARILIREADRQILPDGVYIEQSTCYQSYTAEIYLHFLMLASRNRIPIPTGVIRRLESLLDALLVLRRPNGSLPQIGDADGGRLLPLEPRLPGDASGIFSTAATVLKRGDYAWAAGGLMPDVPWLLGAEGVQVFDRLASGLPAQAPSRLLADGGYAVMRTGWTNESDQVILDAGPLGCRVSGGHGHADLLSIEASFRGQPYIVDPGTFRYTADEGWRSYYRGSAAHSTVEIDAVGHAVPRGPFGWVSRPGAHIIRWTSTPELDTVTAEHHAYGQLQDPVVHRRAVCLVKARYCVIVDDLGGATEHHVRLRFQFAPMAVTLDPTGWVRAGHGTQKGLLLHAFSTSALKPAILEGETDPRQGWVASDYGDHRPAPMLVYSVTAQLPVRIVTLLLPTDTLLASPPSVSPLTEGGCIRGLAFDDGRQPSWTDNFTGHPFGS